MKLKEGYQHAKQNTVLQIKSKEMTEVSQSERDLVSLGNTIINSSELPPPNATSTNTNILWHSVKHNWKGMEVQSSVTGGVATFQVPKGSRHGARNSFNRDMFIWALMGTILLQQLTDRLFLNLK